MKNINKQRLLSRWSLVGGILVALVGTMHTAATPMAYRSFMALRPDKALGGAYFFGVMGIYVIFSGWLMIYSSRGLMRSEKWAWVIALTNGACNALAGVGAMAVGFRHSLVLAWLFTALSISILSILFYRSYHSRA